MKKLLALFLVLTLVLSLAACGAEQDEDKKNESVSEEPTGAQDIAPSEDDEEIQPSAETESTEVTEESTEEPTEEVTEEATEEATSDGGILSGILGKNEGNRYENSFLGIGCELDADWTVYDEEQIAELIGLTADMMDDESISELIENSGVAYLFMAVTAEGDSVNIILENSGTYGVSASVDSYISASMETLDDALAAAGYDTIHCSTEKVDFAGEERTAIVIEAELYGMKLYEMLVPLVYEDCVAVVTIATLNENNCEALLAEFYALAQ